MSVTRTRRIGATAILATLASLLPASAAAGLAHQAEILHPDGAAGESFGFSTATDGDTIVVGAPNDVVGLNTYQGSAQVYTRNGTTWTHQAELLHPGGDVIDFFGHSVAIDGDTIVVGATGDTVGGNPGRGSAHVYTRAGTTWTHQAELLHPNGAAYDSFGISVAIDGDTIIVGAPHDDIGSTVDRGSAHVYTRTNTTWTHQAELLHPNGAAYDYLGISVAIDGNTTIVGARFDSVGSNAHQGSAHVYTRTNSTWTHQAELLHPNGAAGDFFGESVSVDGNTIVVGTSNDVVGSNSRQGSAHVYTRTGTAWTHQAELLHPNGSKDDLFGRSVAIEADTIVASAHLDDVGSNPNQGSAQMYTRAGTAWTHQAELLHPNGSMDDLFGQSVAIDGGTVVIGAPDDSVGSNPYQGSAHVFQDSTPPLIEAVVSPAANAAGWHSRTPVIVSFICHDATGIASCSTPVTLANATTGTTVTGTAIDTAGNTTTTSIVVRIDTTAPTITINTAAATAHAGRSQKKAAAASSGVLRGTVTDVGAGIAGVTVTFRSRIQSPITRAATIAGSRWSVSLAGLPPRPLTAQATALDHAGNTTTTPAITLTDNTQPPTPPTTNPPGTPRTSDLAISRIRYPHTARLTNQLTITYTITNRGPATTRGTKHAITIPQGLRLIAITTPGGIRCHPTLRNITCNTGSLRPGASRTITLTLAATQLGAQTLRITITGPNRDPNTRNDTANTRIHVT